MFDLLELKICFDKILAWPCLENNWQTAQRFLKECLCENLKRPEKTVHKPARGIGHFALIMMHLLFHTENRPIQRRAYPHIHSIRFYVLSL